MAHCHGQDLRDLYRPGGGPSRLTWRRLGVLIRHLPPQSATKTALRNAMDDSEVKDAAQAADPSTGQWSQAEMLLALLIDTVRQLTYTTIRLQHGKKAGKAPEPLPRPGVKQKNRTQNKPRFSDAQWELLFRRIQGEHIEGTVLEERPQPAFVRRQIGPGG